MSGGTQIVDSPLKIDERPLYYDLDRKRYGSEPPGGLIIDALKLFGGSVKAVRRSSGGLVLAEPFQIVVNGDSTGEPSGQPDVRVRVHFRDFKRGPNNLVLRAEYETHTKIVTPGELKDPFRFGLGSPEEPQRFMLDLGHGVIPVRVYHYVEDASGVTFAYFVELADIEKLSRSKLGTRIPVQAYRVERNVLRYAMDDEEFGVPLEYIHAKENYRRLRQAYARVIPEGFRAGTAIMVPAGVAPEDLRHYLPPTTRPAGKAAGSEGGTVEPEPSCFTLDEEEALKPFGMFEG
jgi:hypothetical protein